MDGDYAPLKDIVKLAKKYKAMTMIDEAHATGLIGQHGRGVSELQKVSKDIDIHMGVSEKGLSKIILPSSVLVGVITGVLFELIFPIPEILVNSLLAFISGIILYVIVREVIPEKTKGKPNYFVLQIFGCRTYAFIRETTCGLSAASEVLVTLMPARTPAIFR